MIKFIGDIGRVHYNTYEDLGCVIDEYNVDPECGVYTHYIKIGCSFIGVLYYETDDLLGVKLRGMRIDNKINYSTQEVNHFINIIVEGAVTAFLSA